MLTVRVLLLPLCLCSRERNRVHARKSRLRKKFFLDSLKSNLEKLEDENRRLRTFLESKLGRTYEDLLAESAAGGAGGSGGSDSSGGGAGGSTRGGSPISTAASSGPTRDGRASLLGGPDREPNTVLDRADYALVAALTNSQQNFVVSDPTLPDNPVVFASQGFYELTGYGPADTIGRNCRFLQGAGTDPEAVRIIRQGVAEGRDTEACLINYKKDGTPFWNRFFVAPLRGVDGQIVNFVGVQCEVNDNIARMLIAAHKGKQAHFTAADKSGSGSGSGSSSSGGASGSAAAAPAPAAAASASSSGPASAGRSRRK